MSARHCTLAAGALLALLIGACGVARDLDTGTPELHVADAQASAPVAGVSQLVLSIENRGDGDDRLVAADTDAALAIEIHRTEIEADGRAFMRRLDDVPLPSGEQVHFRPGGLHLMVVVPDERVRVGGTFETTLRFAHSDPITLTVTVVELLDLVERDVRGAG